MDFGFTNDPAQLAKIMTWVQDAIKDGWELVPTYSHETILRAQKLTRDGFLWTAHALTRCGSGKWQFEASLSVWGPDGLSVDPGNKYDWSRLQDMLRKCHYCGATDVDTTRISFAGRCCYTCRKDPNLVAKLEPPGWCD